MASSAEHSAPAYEIIMSIWEVAFKSTSSCSRLQAKLLGVRDIVIHLTINKFDYAAYKMITDTTPENVEPTFADFVARVLHGTIDENNVAAYDVAAILKFLRSDENATKKRKIIAIYLRKSILYGNASTETVVANFCSFCRAVNDGHYLLTAEHHLVYRRGLRLLARPPRGVSADEHIASIVSAVDDNVSNLMTSLMMATDKKDCRTVLACWRVCGEDAKPEDLTLVMWSLFESRRTDECIELYKNNPHLHHDDQIEIFLRISQTNQDWPLLQSQFEEMYGRGDLPHTLHYAVVMNALVTIGLTKEAKILHQQLIQRKLSPSADVYAALIKCELAEDNIDGANKWFEALSRDAEAGIVSPSSLARAHSAIFELHFYTGSVASTMAALRELIDRQKTSAGPLVDQQLLCDIVRFLMATFNLKEFELVVEMAQSLGLDDVHFCLVAIHAYTRFGLHEKADKLAFRSHQNCKVPFTHSGLYAAQLRNYRNWFKETVDLDVKAFISQLVLRILVNFDHGVYSTAGQSQFLVEAIKFELDINREDYALHFLEMALQKECIREAHYVPFLRHYAEKGDAGLSSKVLDMYRKMVEHKIAMSAKTYLYLTKALLKIDHDNGSGYFNSLKLLESVFDLYGLSLLDKIPSSRTPDSAVRDNAVELLQLVASYSKASFSAEEPSMDLVLHFLAQLRARLGKRIGFNFRYSVLREMGELYLQQGNMAMARQLTDNALEELHDIVDNLRSSSEYADSITVPKILQLEYRRAAETKFRILERSGAGADELVATLNDAVTRNIRLSGKQLNTHCTSVLRSSAGAGALSVCLEACERFLVSGNWVEAKIGRKTQHVYKLVVMELLRRVPVSILVDTMRPLNEFYNVGDFRALERELWQTKGGDFDAQLASEVQQLMKLTNRNWALGAVVNSAPLFFNPEIQTVRGNKISPSLATLLINTVEAHCNGDQKRAFKLYDEYPETMEYLLYFTNAKTRLLHFRSHIDHVNVPRSSASPKDRHQRTTAVLQSMASAIASRRY